MKEMKRTKRIEIRVTKEEKEKLLVKAKEKGLSLSTYLRMRGLIK